MGADSKITGANIQKLQKKMIYFRADGNETIASGHLMRCLTIARRLSRAGVLAGFLLSDETSEKLLRSFYTQQERLISPYQIALLCSDYRQPEKELPKLLPFLAAQHASCLLVDSYDVTPEYLTALGRVVKVAYLDDLYAFDYPVDLLINYDLSPREAFYTNAKTKLLGGAYAPLREQFSGSSFRVYRQVKNILLTTGATDACNVAGNLLQLLAKHTGQAQPPCTFHVVAGALNANKDILTRLAQLYPWIILHENVTDMASLMEECDMAISAGGTTLYELCALGIPTISCIIADNQREAVRAFDEKGLIACAGDARCDSDFYASLLSQLRRLSGDYEERKARSLRMRACIDGAGALRIADALLQL